MVTAISGIVSEHRVLAHMALFYAKLFPPKPYVSDRFRTVDGKLRETVMTPSMTCPMYAGKSFNRTISESEELTNELFASGDYTLFSKEDLMAKRQIQNVIKSSHDDKSSKEGKSVSAPSTR